MGAITHGRRCAGSATARAVRDGWCCRNCGGGFCRHVSGALPAVCGRASRRRRNATSDGRLMRRGLELSRILTGTVTRGIGETAVGIVSFPVGLVAFGLPTAATLAVSDWLPDHRRARTVARVVVEHARALEAAMAVTRAQCETERRRSAVLVDGER